MCLFVEIYLNEYICNEQFEILRSTDKRIQKVNEEKKVLVTGASGFIGHYLIQMLLDHGYDAYAGVRKGSRTQELLQMGAKLVYLNMDSIQILREELRLLHGQIGKWEFVVHTAGVTKCRDRKDFNRVNNENTRRLLNVLSEEDMIPDKFIFVSSLSVYGPIHEEDGLPIHEEDVPLSDTAYGCSKLSAEDYLRSLKNIPFVILRPTGVYGPREKDYFMMAQSIQRHIDVSVGFRPQVLTFVYVADVCQAVLRSMESKVTNRCYALTDGKEYTSRDFSELIQKELGIKTVFRFCLPLWVLKTVSFSAQMIASWLGRSSTLNLDKYRIMKQRNWRCDITPARRELGYTPEYDLARGVKETINWYKKEGWL